MKNKILLQWAGGVLLGCGLSLLGLKPVFVFPIIIIVVVISTYLTYK